MEDEEYHILLNRIRCLEAKFKGFQYRFYSHLIMHEAIEEANRKRKAIRLKRKGKTKHKTKPVAREGVNHAVL